MFDKLIARIEKKDGKLYVHEGCYKDFGLLMRFPSAMFENLPDRQAVLAHQSCDDGVACMHDSIKYFLAGKPRALQPIGDL